MSPEWAWPGLLASAVLPAIGHVYHFILVVNVSSGLGISERRMNRIRGVLFAALFATSAVLLCCHFRAPWWTWRWPLRGYPLVCVVSGGILFPLNSLFLALRKPPGGIAGRSVLIDLTADSGRESLIGSGGKSWQLRLQGNEAFRLHKRDWELAYPALPEALEGLRIVQLTDLHLAPCYGLRFFEHVIEAFRDWTADLVVITGDLVEDDAVIPWLEPLLEPLQARIGKFAILGNHDNECHPARILESLADAGFESLEGHWVAVEANGLSIAVGGTLYPWGPAPDPRTIPPAAFRILLSHSPDLLYRAGRWGVDLMLSGHNHGGQIRLPAIGPVFMPSIYSRRFDRGFFRSGPTLMYVSEGIAGTNPARYGCPPEICRFTLRRDVGFGQCEAVSLGR
jgi:predicted MPP superfamily phosphohydrolase